jgi:hypothetical protein
MELQRDEPFQADSVHPVGLVVEHTRDGIVCNYAGPRTPEPLKTMKRWGGRARRSGPTWLAISNGSACTSSYTPSHVIKAMVYSDDEANEAIRLSWCHLTPEMDWAGLAARVRNLR